jgi:hypothetical protein
MYIHGMGKRPADPNGAPETGPTEEFSGVFGELYW